MQTTIENNSPETSEDPQKKDVSKVVAAGASKLTNRRGKMIQTSIAFTEAELDLVNAAAEAAHLGRSAFIRWVIFKHLG